MKSSIENPAPNATETRAVAPLTDIEPGERVRFVSADAGQALLSRLAAMGLLPGAPIEVIRNSGRGPFVLLVRGSRLMLGRGMAERIRVTGVFLPGPFGKPKS